MSADHFVQTVFMCPRCLAHDARVTHICPPLGESTTKWLVTGVSVTQAPITPITSSGDGS